MDKNEIKIPNRLLEGFLLAACISEVVPEVIIKVRSGKQIRGKCVSYQYEKPKRIKVMKDDRSIYFVDLDAVIDISVLNIKDIYQKHIKDKSNYTNVVKRKHTLKFFDLIDLEESDDVYK